MILEPGVIELFEYEPQEISRRELPLEAAQLILDRYKGKISIAPVSFQPDSDWKIYSEGWVGYIPLTEDLGLRLSPKKGVTISNIFRMLEYAYDLKSFQLQDGLIDCQFTEELYERLAAILAWTLSQILRSGICTDRTLPTVRHAYRKLDQSATVRPCRPGDCAERVYTRLNQDYEPMIALCRLFLECRGPGHEAGERRMIPFLVNMAGLFELFVARWLEKNLQGERYAVASQEEVRIDPHLKINFRIDLSLIDQEEQSCIAVMDTKYKIGSPKAEDIEQAAAYAEARGCKQAILIYPELPSRNLEATVGNITVRSATFSLSEDPEIAGRRFAKEALNIEIK